MSAGFLHLNIREQKRLRKTQNETFYHLIFMPEPDLVSSQSLCTFISAASKFAQLQCLWSSKDAGQVSALSWAMATYTCMARIYTTTVTTGDMQVLVRFVAMTLLNLWVLLTVIYYQRRTGSSSKKTD
uniref:PQ loop repeat containing 3 n=1 Tax=Nothobranchius furzeri TaxID=105023 RepID=A0A1A7ZBS7_NOTFU